MLGAKFKSFSQESKSYFKIGPLSLIFLDDTGDTGKLRRPRNESSVIVCAQRTTSRLAGYLLVTTYTLRKYIRTRESELCFLVIECHGTSTTSQFLSYVLSHLFLLNGTSHTFVSNPHVVHCSDRRWILHLRKLKTTRRRRKKG